MRNQLLLWRHQQDHTLYSLQDGRTGIQRSGGASPTARDPETCQQAALPAPVTCLQVTCLQAAVTCLQAALQAPAKSSSLYRYVCLQAPFTIQMHLSAGTWMPALLHVSEMPALLDIPRSYTHTPHLLTCHHSSTSPTAYLVVSLLHMRQCREMWLCGEMPDVVRWLSW